MTAQNKKNYSHLTNSELLIKLKRVGKLLQKIMEGYQSYCEYNGDAIWDICRHHDEAKEVLEELKVVERNKHYFELLTALFNNADVNLVGCDEDGIPVLEVYGYTFKKGKKAFSADYEFSFRDSELLWFVAYGKWQSYEKCED